MIGAWEKVRYTYAYKTSDGARHEASMDAQSREDVFAALREKGIKAIKVVAADGSRANGEVRGVRKRVVAAFVVCAALLAGLVVFLTLRVPGSARLVAKPLPRQMIVGDRSRVDPSKVGFERRAEAFLARFAEPGRPFSAPECDWPSKKEFEEALSSAIEYVESDHTEQIDLKRMVVWMEHELRRYVGAGGYYSGYIRELISRQEKEISERNKAQRRLDELIKCGNDQKAAYDYWSRANAALRTMGIYPLELPPSLLSLQASETTDL